MRVSGRSWPAKRLHDEFQMVSHVVPHSLVSRPTLNTALFFSPPPPPTHTASRLSYATAQSLTFEQWVTSYGKTYKSPDDVSKAKRTFEQNVKIVSHLNDLYKGKYASCMGT